MILSLQSLLSNPYYRAGGVVARLAVNAATITWALIVLWFRDSILLAPERYAWIAEYVDEQRVAIVLLVLSVLQMVWLVFHLPPWSPRWWPASMPLGASGYGVVATWWLFVAISASPVDGPIKPALFSCASVVSWMGFCGWFSVPRHDELPATDT